MHAGVEVFQIEELIEGTNDGVAEGGSLLFESLNPERIQRPQGPGSLRERWNLVVRHCSYQQSKRQEPEPEPEPELEPELFTQAEIAWYASRRPRLRSGVSLTAWD